MIRFAIPGEPHAQGRARAGLIPKKGGGFVTGPGGRPIVKVRDPKESRTWKHEAQSRMVQALAEEGLKPFPVDVPLRVRVYAIYPCPSSQHLKASTRPRRWCPKAKDADNIAKAVLDAGNAVMWADDRAVATLEVFKIIGAQGEFPRTVVEVEALTHEDLMRVCSQITALDQVAREAAALPRRRMDANEAARVFEDADTAAQGGQGEAQHERIDISDPELNHEAASTVLAGRDPLPPKM